MAGVSKVPLLLSTPSSLLCPRPSLLVCPRPSQLPLTSLSLALRGTRHHAFASSSRPRHGFLLRAAAEQAHAQTSTSEGGVEVFGPCPWPEWARMVEHLTARGYMGRQPSAAHGQEGNDAFSVLGALPKEFTEAAGACLLFAREKPDLVRLLPRRDIEVVVENVAPFLFKNTLDSVRRMKAFIGSDGSNVLASEQAYTVDVMRYLLSYISNSFSKGGEDDIKHREFVESSVKSLLNELVKADDAVQEPSAADSAGHTSFRHEQSQKPSMQKIGMKRGDWICPKCSFMNFARNMQCFECKEARPRRRLTGEEWECPQCEFFNHGRNMACLRCECKRPEESSAQDIRLVRVQSKNIPGNEDLVEGSASMGGAESGKNTESAISQRLDRILGRGLATSEAKGTGNQSALGERGVKNVLSSLEMRDPGYVPFVPLPADMFRKKPTDEQQQAPVKEECASTKADELKDAVLQGPEPENSDVSSYSEDFNNQTLGKTSKESSDQSERLSSNSLQRSDENNLRRSVSDVDFPEIMPMRKGENRFVVSKKKDRSLTSPQYKRRIAMEQANNSNFVPFVPFPPGYFAQKDKQPEDDSSIDKSAAETSAHAAAGNSQSMPQKAEGNQNGEASWEDAGNIQQNESPKANGIKGAPTLGQRTNNPLHHNAGSFSGEPSQEGTASVRSLNQKVENPRNESENGIQVFSGKSLEGSAVTEPDPLDMSEEAKAQRWFRRVAQINDISELSKIPDEDFPEIMPMRKGVNRFVVSKRKTPLERRLTSQQYRRNLPIVSSERETDSNDSAQQSGF